jgi:hypothetical protein
MNVLQCGFEEVRFALAVSLLLGAASGFGAESEERWWPVQIMPKTLVRTEVTEPVPERRAGLEMMVQSMAGLAAKAVNERRGDTMIWVNNGNVDMENWYTRLLALHPALKKSDTAEPWSLVDRFAKAGIIKGYILYRRDRSKGQHNAYRSGMDCSVNVATSLAGVLGGLIVDEELENVAKGHGIKLLLDVRAKTQAWCFQTYREQFTRKMLCTQDPRKPHIRDLAIAQKAFTLFGEGDPLPGAMEWLEPLSPILGWNGGDEFRTTELSSSYGHIQTATDWCMNLPVLMAGTEKVRLTPLRSLDPRTIKWGDARSAVSFISTDGDNMQWFEGNFFRNESYWGNPERGKIPYGWSSCFAHLAQLCPEAIEYAAATRTTNDSLIEWGGGYYFPDRFGSKRTNRWELLARQAERTWVLMKRTDTRIIGFNFAKYDSADARKAYEIFASQTDGMLAILVFEYSAYEAGAGQIFWVKDHRGIEVPVITARYSIWEHSNNRDRAGTPAKVAREIVQAIMNAGEIPRYDWVIAHAWSYFQRSPGSNENSENIPQENAAGNRGARGYSPVIWTAERLPANIRVVSPEELIWRIRMKHNPTQTKELIR